MKTASEHQAKLWAEQYLALVKESQTSPGFGYIGYGDLAQVAALLVQPHCQNLAEQITRNGMLFSEKIGAVDLTQAAMEFAADGEPAGNGKPDTET